LLKLLLPIPYKDEFFSEILSDPEVGSLARIALWRDDIPKKRQKDDEDEHAAAIDTDLVQPTSAEEDRSTVVGGVRCRLEPVPCPPDVDDPVQKHQLYIQTLAVLSPYSGQGIATHLLEQVLVNALHNHFVTSVYAHVWECNEEGLEWYKRRGFKVEAQMLHGYYQRLRPAGAWVLRRVVGVSDHLKVNNRDVVN
jgi:ribosomal protein S18 acetylase RimI-like enzyme